MPTLDKFQFTWKIENFSMLPHQNGEYLDSANFTTHIFEGVDFFLRLYPRGTKSLEKYLSCFLYLSKSGTSSVQVGYSLTLQAFSYHDDIMLESESKEFVVGYGFGWKNFAALDYIDKLKTDFLPKDVFTLKCVVWSPRNKAIMPKLINVEPSCSLKFSSRTQIQVFKRCFTWPIKKVGELRDSNGKVYFCLQNALVNTPSFKLTFFFSEDSNCEHARILITKTSQENAVSVEKSVFVKCKITVMNGDEENDQPSQEDTFLFKHCDPKTWHFPNFIETAELVTGKYIHMDDTLYLLCEFSFSFEDPEVSHIEIPAFSETIFEMPEAAQQSHLSRSIRKFYTDATFCDVTLKAEGRSFPAQKLVLCAQSPVFHAMFTNNMEEKATNVVEIDDIDVETIERMLEYLHSDTIEDEHYEMSFYEQISNLYIAADKYQISHLKQYCIRRLLLNLSVGNIDDVLIFADRYQEHFLMSYAQYFLKTCGIEVFQSESWENFLSENPSLCGKVMIQVMKNM